MSVFYLLKVFHGGLEKAKTLFIDEGIEPTMRLFLKGTLLEQIFGIINQTPIQRKCVMKSSDGLKAEMETIWQQMTEAKKNERTDALKKVKEFCKEFGFTSAMLQGALAESRTRK